MNVLNSLPPEGLAILASVAAILISENLSPDETNVLGNFIVSVGSIMLTIAAQEQFLKSQDSIQAQNDLLNQQMDLLKKQVDSLQNNKGKH